MQDAVAAMTGIAQLRHRPVDLAVATVASAASYSAQDAFDKGLVDGTAASLDDVLNQVDLKTATVGSAQVELHTKGATIVTIGEDPIQSILHGLDDPNIAFILLVLGVLLVVIELFHPTLVMGLLGALCLALSFYGSGSLPLNMLGVVLVILGIAMFVLEPNLPSHGLLAVGGLASFVVGAVAFYGSPGPYLPAATVAWPIIATMAAAAAAYGLILVRTLVRMRHQALPAGSGMVGTVDVIGMTGVVEKDLNPLGTVYVARESWSARLAGGGSAVRGERVKVVRKEGLILVVDSVE
jgi:membrane-bound serine protease (ClpP class)